MRSYTSCRHCIFTKASRGFSAISYILVTVIDELPPDVCLSVTYIGPNSRTERPRKTKIGTEVAHVTRDSDTTFKVKRAKVKAVLVGCTGRPTWTYSNGDLSICVHDVYIVSPLAGLGGGISWRPPVYSLFIKYPIKTVYLIPLSAR